MNCSDASVTAVLGLFAVVAVLSGPLVPFVGLGGGSGAPTGSGGAAVTVERAPVEGIELVRGEFGAGTYHFESTPGRVAVDAVDGNPVLRLVVDAPGVGYTDVRSYELGGRGGETLELRFRPADISPERVTEDRYDATVSVWLRSGDEFDQVYQETVSVPVRR